MNTKIAEFVKYAYNPDLHWIDFDSCSYRSIGRMNSYSDGEIVLGESIRAYMKFYESHERNTGDWIKAGLNLHKDLINLPEETTLEEAALYVLKKIYDLRGNIDFYGKINERL